MNTYILKHIIISFAIVIFTCSSPQVVVAQQEKDTSANPIQQCSPRGHWHCVRLTAEEAFMDGVRGKWSRHWGRMSYIGQACKHDKGKVLGVMLEGVWAVPHYMGVGIMNITGFLEHLALQAMIKDDAREQPAQASDSTRTDQKESGKTAR